MQIFGDKETKRKLIESVSAVKKKIKLLNEDKADITSALKETFEPITKPLNTLVNQLNTNENEKKIVENVENDDDDDDDIYEDTHESSSSEPGESINPLAQKYIDNMIINKLKKIPLGVYNTSDGFHVGNSHIEFDKDYVKIQNELFKCTPGLMELLFKKDPNTSLITAMDGKNYYKIIEMTNAHRRNYSSEGQIQGDKSLKYTNYIKHFIKSGGGLLMKNYCPKTDYKYWDDPNELVDRLRLLIASKNAGNNNHNNEIIAITEELVEANIIESSSIDALK